MQNSNWGSDKSAVQRIKVENTDNSLGNYHRGYVGVLETIGNIIIFLVPILPAILVYITLYTAGSDMGLLIGIVTYVVFAFILWIVISYCIKMFDNVSKMSQNTELILTMIQKGKDND